MNELESRDLKNKGPTASVKTLSLKYDIKARTIREWMTQRKFVWYKPAKLVLIDVSSFEGFLFRNKMEPWKPAIIKDRMSDRT